MAERSVLNLNIRAATALAVMIAVMASPIRPARAADHSCRHACLGRNFAVPRIQPVRLSAIAPASRAVCVVPARSEDEPGPGSARPARTPSDRRRAPALEPAPSPIAPGVLRAMYMLRC